MSSDEGDEGDKGDGDEHSQRVGLIPPPRLAAQAMWGSRHSLSLRNPSTPSGGIYTAGLFRGVACVAKVTDSENDEGNEGIEGYEGHWRNAGRTPRSKHVPPIG